MTKEFLSLMTPKEALRLFLQSIPHSHKKSMQINVTDSLGYVTAVPVIAQEPSPAFPKSTMDGYAVRAKDTYGASESLPAYLRIVGEIPMGKSPGFEIGELEAGLIHTGGMLPKGADAVVMVENTQIDQRGQVEIFRAVAVGENTVAVGEDVRIGETIISAGRRIRPMEIGGMLSVGIQQVEVVQPPRFGILSSGDEVVSPEKTVLPGQVRDINSYTLGSLIQQYGGQPVFYGIFPDVREELEKGVRRAWEACDAVVVTAGSSVSARDMTAGVIQELGQPGVLVHGINIRPGKPTILAVCGSKPVIGLPGNPVSALVIARLFVIPVLERLLGIMEHPELMVRAKLTINLPSDAGREEWVPVKLTEAEGEYRAEPVFYKSSLIFSLTRADGLAYLAPDVVGANAGEELPVLLL